MYMITIETDTKVHIFEAAGLGKAPFSYVGMEEKAHSLGNGHSKAGGTCDYCGASIRYCFNIRSSDGKKFHVGCDCVLKTDDTGLRKVVTAEKRKLEAAKKRQLRINAHKYVADALADLDARAVMADEPHPYAKPGGYFQDRSFLDYAEFTLVNGGLTGIKKIASMIAIILATSDGIR